MTIPRLPTVAMNANASGIPPKFAATPENVVSAVRIQRGVPSRSYTPQQVKDAVCGHGRAGKDQVGRMVARLLGLSGTPSPDHAADALAVAICDLNRAPLSRAVAGVPA